MGGTVLGIDAAANDKIGCADLSLELDLNITFVMSMLHECVQLA